jgi:flagellar hook-associated protein 3 FlgL
MPYQRITNNYINSSVMNNLINNRELLIDLQKKISSGKEIENPSENVFSAATIMRSDTSLGKIETYLKSINSAKSEIDASDSTIQNTLESIHKSRELVVQALNATSGDTEMNLIGNEIEQIRQQIVEAGNTKFGSTYLFSGQSTTTVPFQPGMNPGEIEYKGSTDGTPGRSMEIADGITVQVNLSGDDVFGYYYTDDNGTPANPLDDTVKSKGLLGSLPTLSKELALPNPDKEKLRQQLANLDTDLNTLLSAQSTLGGLSSRLDITQKVHEDNKINITEIKSGVQDVDMAKAISDLSYQQTALQASLQVSASVIQPSLLNYLSV